MLFVLNKIFFHSFLSLLYMYIYKLYLKCKVYNTYCMYKDKLKLEINNNIRIVLTCTIIYYVLFVYVYNNKLYLKINNICIVLTCTIIYVLYKRVCDTQIRVAESSAYV